MNTYETNPMRGEIYYVARSYTQGEAPESGRPAVIVSNDMLNEFRDVYEVVYLTMQEDNDLPTHVTVRGTGKTSIALCERVEAVHKSRMRDYIAKCSEAEMEAIDTALMVAFGIDITASKPIVKTVEKEVVKEVPVEVVKEVPVPVENTEELTALRAQLSLMQTMYNNLMERIL